MLGLLATLFALVVLGSGIWWAEGGDLVFAGFGLLNWHIILGFTLAAAILGHMFARAKRLRKRDITGRRQLFQFGALLVGAVALWPIQQVTEHRFQFAGRSATIYRLARSWAAYAGNAFPTSSWVADQPRPIDTANWQLALDGAVKTPRTFSYDELVARWR